MCSLAVRKIIETTRENGANNPVDALEREKRKQMAILTHFQVSFVATD